MMKNNKNNEKMPEEEIVNASSGKIKKSPNIEKSEILKELKKLKKSKKDFEKRIRESGIGLPNWKLEMEKSNKELQDLKEKSEVLKQILRTEPVEELKNLMEESEIKNEISLKSRKSAPGRIETEASPMRILYRSLEYPNNFVKKLQLQMTGFTVELASKDRNGSDYHLGIKKLLKYDIDELLKQENLPDIIVLGEFTPIKEVDVAPRGYKVIGNVNLEGEKGSEARGTRGMTVIAKEDSANWHRITVHNKSSESVDYWNEQADKWVPNANKYLEDNLGINPDQRIQSTMKERRILKQYHQDKEPITNTLLVKEYEESRESLKEKMRESISNLGQFIEIMYKNHYMSLVHVKGLGTVARSNIVEASKKMSHMNFGGDTNLNISSSKFENHQYESEINNTLTIKMNTIPFIFGTSNSFDPPGKTASGNVAHDGIVIQSAFDAVYKILSSRWALHDSDLPGEKILSSDHKGILISVNPSMTSKQPMVTPVKKKLPPEN